MTVNRYGTAFYGITKDISRFNKIISIQNITKRNYDIYTVVMAHVHANVSLQRN